MGQMTLPPQNPSHFCHRNVLNSNSQVAVSGCSRTFEMDQFSTVDLDEKKTKPPPVVSSTTSPSQTPDHVSYPKLDPDDLVPPPPPPPEAGGVPAHKSVSWSSKLTHEAPPDPLHAPAVAAAGATTMPGDSNPYITPSPAPSSSSSKVTMDKVKSMLGRWGKKVGEAAKKTEDLAGNTWQHLRTGPSFADAAMGRITQTTKVIAEGGYEKIFRHTFQALPEEQLKKSFACYLSTSVGPVMGILYLSTAKLAFCSDNPLSYKNGENTEWSYYKVVIPLHQLKTVNPSASKVKAAEKYIQVVSIDNHEFWFLGFVKYDDAVKNLQEASLAQSQQPQVIVP